MVGKQHINEAHDQLIPLVNNLQKVESNQVEKLKEDKSFEVIQTPNTVRSRSAGNIPGTSYGGSGGGSGGGGY